MLEKVYLVYKRLVELLEEKSFIGNKSILFVRNQGLAPYINLKNKYVYTFIFAKLLAGLLLELVLIDRILIKWLDLINILKINLFS